jgi:hypothetical protein
MDKSRDVGATWLMVAFLVHRWLFYPGFNGSIGSRKLSLVDSSGDPDCIFEKARQLIRKLPYWMIPGDWEKYSRVGMIKNPINESVITGSGGDQVGRGGRSSVYFVDESAFIERSQKVIAALSQNTDCLIQVSTPNGTDNEFYRCITDGNMPRMSIHWKDDPRKNKWVAEDGTTGQGWDAPIDAVYPWYEKQKKDLSPVVLAQELNLDYSASVEGILIKAAWVRAAIGAHHKIPGIDSGGELSAGLDVAAGGSNQSVLWLCRGGYVLPEVYRWGSLDPVQLAYAVDDLLRDLGVKYLCFDADGVGMGVAGTLDILDDKPYHVTPFHGASTKGLEFIQWKDGTAKDKFKNNRAAYYAMLAERFRKTYAMVNGIKDYPVDELISIPNEPTLITQLSQPTVKYSTGKIVLSPKNLLATSPDDADALCYTFSQGIPAVWWD